MIDGLRTLATLACFKFIDSDLLALYFSTVKAECKLVSSCMLYTYDCRIVVKTHISEVTLGQARLIAD